MIVYFIKPVGHDGPIKIGKSKCPEKRLSHFNRTSPLDLEIIATWPGDDERRFHAAFAASHRRNEWFDPTPKMRRTIDQLQRGVFDASTLPRALYLPKPDAAWLKTDRPSEQGKAA